MQFPIAIGLRRSRFLDAALAATACLAVAGVLAWPRSQAVQWTFVLAIAGLSILAWRQLGPTLADIRLERDGRILVRAVGQAEFRPARMLAGATAHPWLTVIRLESVDGHRHRVVITVDSLPAEDFRRLRLVLRWQAAVTSAGEGP